MSDAVSEPEYVDFLLWQMGEFVSIAPEVSRIRSYLIAQDMNVEPTDDWIRGWTGAEFDNLNSRHTEDPPDLAAMVFAADLNSFGIFSKVIDVTGYSPAINIIGYLYAYAKFNNMWTGWNATIEYIEARYEEKNRDA